MAQDAATKAVIQDFGRQGKALAVKFPEFPFVPSEQRTRAATAVNELHTARRDRRREGSAREPATKAQWNVADRPAPKDRGSDLSARSKSSRQGRKALGRVEKL